MEVNTLNYLKRYGVKDRFIAEAAQYPEYELARITAQYRGRYKVVTEHGEALAQLSGKMRFDTEELAQYPTVGDYAMVSKHDGHAETVIHRLLTRKSLFLRKAVGISGQAQAVAANVDTVFLCMSLNQNFNLNRMERYLSIAWDSGATPVVVLTKKDLCCDLETAVKEVEQIAFFSDVLVLSMFDEQLDEKFAPYFSEEHTCAFIGSSGVGKSTIINRILGKDVLETQEVGRDDKGRHTTTGREMFPCPLGGVVIDTSGMREMGAESADVSKAFCEIDDLAEQCRFRDCTHTNEPGCAVLAAIKNGVVDQRRLDSYLKLQQEAGYDGLSSKEIEAQKLDRMFKEVGGMKNARKFAKGQRKR
ncbi:MAG: ribosome small subunit-dependent GTPase A [Agathobaculum sp.]|nr:ribosome small subunit-dependent GTPase A [Agathobaculum sp.]MDY3619443.1 ribosome small subunit-dependent GTPase A [Agathobaculum sp.]